MLTNKMNPECPFKYAHAQVSTRALKTIQSGRPQSLPPSEYLSFRNPDPYLLAIILNSTVSISTLLANPCAMPCIYKPRNLFQLSSASTSEAVFVVLFWFLLKSFYTCHAVFVLWCREIFSTDGSLKKSPFCSLLEYVNTAKVMP